MVSNTWMRNEVVRVLQALSDPEYQQKVWIQHNYPDGIKYDDFDLAVHILFDDTFLAEDPTKEIGHILRNNSEARRIHLVTQAIDRLFDSLGTNKADIEYMNDSMWPEVVSLSIQALDEFSKN